MAQIEERQRNSLRWKRFCLEQIQVFEHRWDQNDDPERGLDAQRKVKYNYQKTGRRLENLRNPRIDEILTWKTNKGGQTGLAFGIVQRFDLKSQWRQNRSHNPNTTGHCYRLWFLKRNQRECSEKGQEMEVKRSNRFNIKHLSWPRKRTR